MRRVAWLLDRLGVNLNWIFAPVTAWRRHEPLRRDRIRLDKTSRHE